MAAWTSITWRDSWPQPAEDFLPDLKGLVFLNPQTRPWETDDQYLSGNVREKLAVAEAATITDPASPRTSRR